MTMNSAVLPVLAGYVVAAEEQGVSQTSSSGISRTTSSKEFMVRNTCLPAQTQHTDHRRHRGYTARNTGFNSISISGYHITGSQGQ